MIKLSKLLLIAVLFGATYSALADGGIAKKSKSKVTLNISTPTILKNSVSLNLRAGLHYTGSYLINQNNFNRSMLSTTVVTYQKGNSVYIIPYKQKIVMPEVKAGYTGMKLILRVPSNH
ncbi:MAG: hypothetical protein WDM90_10280 [Ferruginibacter sp.]